MPARGRATIFPDSLSPALRFLCVLGALFPWTTQLHAQSPAPNLRPPDDFHSTVQRAGLIFDGTVTAIQCELGKGRLPQTYRITFQIRQGVRGIRTGSTYSIHEWAGLWSATQKPRYRVGERALLFLYAPRSTGLTSTIGGSNGKLPIVSDLRSAALTNAPTAVRGARVFLPPVWQSSVGLPPPAHQTSATSPAQARPTPALQPFPQVPLDWLIQRIQQSQSSPAGAR